MNNASSESYSCMCIGASCPQITCPSHPHHQVQITSTTAAMPYTYEEPLSWTLTTTNITREDVREIAREEIDAAFARAEIKFEKKDLDRIKEIAKEEIRKALASLSRKITRV